MPRPKKSFSPEFKDEAAKMVIETSRPIAKVGKELGINEGTLVTGLAYTAVRMPVRNRR